MSDNFAEDQWRDGNESPPDAERPQFGRVSPDYSSLIWNLSLTDDQDEVSERFLLMRAGQTTAAAAEHSIGFGQALMRTIPENIMKQADQLFKPWEIDANEIYDSANAKASWLITSVYQQYLTSLAPNVLEQKKTHVLYPWTQNTASTDTGHSEPFNSGGQAPAESSATASDRSWLSTSSSPLAFRAQACGASPGSNNVDNVSGSSGSGGVNNVSYNSSTSDLYGVPLSSSSPTQRHDAEHSDGRHLQLQRQPLQHTHASASQSSVPGRSPLPPWSSAALNGVRWPSRIFCSVDADRNTINKLVEHYCTFCYKNREPPEVYGGHLIRNSTHTTCPKLRALRCKHCNSTGDNAHTIKYCPYLYSNYG